MRKGLLSLSKTGKSKTKNMELAEKQVGKKTPESEQELTPTPEKPFVQTIQIPKPGTVQRKKSRKHCGKKTLPTGK